MEFEADPAKAAENFRKHKVSFEEAASIFGDSMELTFPDPDHSIGEMRWLSFGMSGRGRVLERRGKIRLISARLATKRERKIYEED